MNKKLLAIAVSGALAAPGIALAQSSVTISGFFKGGYESLRIKNFTAGLRSSQHGVADDSSRLIFNVTEDLGGGLAAVGQIDIRFKIDDPQGTEPRTPNAGVGGLLASGNTWVGLRSKNWGRLVIGKQDLHYFGRESDLTAKGSLRADSISLLAFAGGGATAIAGATRTQNVVHYTSPNWAGFSFIAAYSSNPTARDGDLGSTLRRGRAVNIAPTFAAKNWVIGYSYWSSKPDAVMTTTCPAATVTSVDGAIVGACGAGGVTTAAATDQRGDRLFGSFTWAGFKIGLAWDKSKLKSATTGATTSNRTAWSIPASYTWGPHSIHGHYTKARNDKATAAQDGARMFALSYAYDLSKRTSVALTYATIRNDVGAAYNFFTSASLGLGATTAADQDPRMWGVTLRHAF